MLAVNFTAFFYNLNVSNLAAGEADEHGRAGKSLDC